jgi:GNAT superfamily N-acetyltransferase
MIPVVRTATLEDSLDIVRLLPHLGYEANQEQVAVRLAKLLESQSHAVFVAEAAGEVLGLCMLSAVIHLASSGYAEVLELVVNPTVQRQGLGAALLRKGELWAAAQGYGRVRLRSGVHRTEAHEFYERQGYAKSRASFAFERSIAGSNPSIERTASSGLRPLPAAAHVER